MLLAFKLFWAVAALELMVWLVPSLRWRRAAALPLAVLVGAASLFLLFVHPSIPTGLLLLMSLYRVCNLLRLVKARMNEQYLHRMTLQTSLGVIGGQSVVLLAWQLGSWLNVSTYHLWLVLAYIDLAGVAVLAITSVRHAVKTRPPRLSGPGIADHDLPTLTVAIPARNETDDLQACLASLVASDYPKLEILVLDDCSQNKHTPEIIRSFAHAGVVFIQGHEPAESWLAKNQAYEQLFEAANGDLILFCGVDVRFAPESLRHIVGAMLHKQKSMMSLIPRNAVPAGTEGWSTLLQPMRYAWELALPRRLFHRPPVLSTCWIAKRELIRSAGGFGAVSRSIVPESYFARQSIVHDGYSFMQSNDTFGITSQKRLREQLATAIRTRYPQLHRRMELVLLVTLVELFGVFLPCTLILDAIFGRLSLQLTIVSVIIIVALTFAYMNTVALTYRRWLLRSAVLMPVAIALDIVLLNRSMVQYEFFNVFWRGRNVSVPVMHVAETAPAPLLAPQR
ncbi:MAG TPA: glycosyltransferase [Candidatus Saccharimonadales bacterium]|nr:glycosyltransferase [Candidatus Saccharimonadales bacterium]